MRLPKLLALATLLGATACAQRKQPPTIPYKVVHSYPHDTSAYTEGLFFADGALYEGTGLNSHSALKKVDLATGRTLAEHDLSPELFGEGITDWKDRVYELTWKSGLCFVYNRGDFKLLHTFHYAWEGWGLTHDDTSLITSDGTPTVRFLDPDTFAVRRTITVTSAGRPVQNVNELEYVHGLLYANVWQTDRIAILSPGTGEVKAWIDLTGIMMGYSSGHGSDAVLNGIAYDPKAGRLFVTGKQWPALFEIKLQGHP